jgi:hypothetical protein
MADEISAGLTNLCRDCSHHYLCNSHAHAIHPHYSHLSTEAVPVARFHERTQRPEAPSPGLSASQTLSLGSTPRTRPTSLPRLAPCDYYHPPGTAQGCTNQLRYRRVLHERHEARPCARPSHADTMSMKQTPFDAVCSQMEHPKMSLARSRCLQLEPLLESIRVPPHHACLITFPIAPVGCLLVPSVMVHYEDFTHQEACPGLGLIPARSHFLAGELPPSVSDEPYLTIPVFHLDQGPHLVPGYRDISAFIPRRGTLPRSDNDVVHVRLILNETKIPTIEETRRRKIIKHGWYALTDRFLRASTAHQK